ncbi:MAG: hypothetical protein JWO08_114 [Verrucomicrobiaceae bacterium]|nr:hypothetical protein [Verrucomicrobiaceae bacterium]
MECGGVEAEPYNGMSGRLLGTPFIFGAEPHEDMNRAVASRTGRCQARGSKGSRVLRVKDLNMADSLC